MNRDQRRAIEVWADWEGIAGPHRMGSLLAARAGGGETFSFEYDTAWLRARFREEVDPDLKLLRGPQYAVHERANFGVFLDSSPDRWGRQLMQRREEREARKAARPKRTLMESDYLLGVHDVHRMGGLRFKLQTDGPFLDDRVEMAAPPIARLRELENASLQLERDGAEERREYDHWLRMLLAPGGSLGGARPKASVIDEEGSLWIAKFPSRRDGYDVGAWEMVLHILASTAGIEVAPARAERFSGAHRTFLSRRFDRSESHSRLHFSSSMTLLARSDGDDHASGTSYLELAEILIRRGAAPDADLEQLWRRIVFFMCVSCTDDHLRNHGFLQVPGRGWKLSPAYDMNPDPEGDGLRLNVSESDNAQDLLLAESVAAYFRVQPRRAREIMGEVKTAVRRWRSQASALKIARAEQIQMERAFRLVK